MLLYYSILSLSGIRLKNNNSYNNNNTFYLLSNFKVPIYFFIRYEISPHHKFPLKRPCLQKLNLIFLLAMAVGTFSDMYT